MIGIWDHASEIVLHTYTQKSPIFSSSYKNESKLDSMSQEITAKYPNLVKYIGRNVISVRRKKVMIKVTSSGENLGGMPNS